MSRAAELALLSGVGGERSDSNLARFATACSLQLQQHPPLCRPALRSPPAACRIHRIGPLVSRGGNNFMIARDSDIFELVELLERLQGRVSIRKIFFAVVSAVTGEILGYPPIHIHHSHLGPHATIGILDFVAPLHFPHGETSCQSNEGGTACFMFSFPEGLGFELDVPLLFNAYINDVRTPGSSPLPLFLELAIEYSPTPSEQSVGLWYASHESDANAFSMLLAGQQTFYTFEIPLGGESISWAVFKSENSGRFLNLWHHTHVTEGFTEQWLVAATPSALGLEAGEIRLRDNAAPRTRRMFLSC